MIQIGFKAVAVASGFGVLPKAVFAQGFIDGGSCCCCWGARCVGAKKVKVATRLVVHRRALLMAHGARQALDRVLNLAHQLFEFQARLAHARDEFSGENAVGVVICIAQAIQPLLASAGRVDNHLTLGRVWRAQAARCATHVAALVLQGVVAAGIQQHQAEGGFGLAQVIHDVVQGVRGFLDLGLTVGLNVGGQQDAAVLELHAVAGEEHHHLVTARDAGVKRLHRLDHRAVAKVFVQHHFKPGRAQLSSHGDCIIAGLLQLGDLLVIVIAHHQRDALGMHRQRAQPQHGATDGKSQKSRKHHGVSDPAACRESCILYHNFTIFANWSVLAALCGRYRTILS